MQTLKVFNLRKLWLSLLLLVGATAIAVPGIQEVMDGNVAKIGSTEYATLQAAFDAAQDGETVTLLSDYSATGETNTIETNRNLCVTKSITIDGQNHTLTVNKRGIAVKGISSKIDVTFKDITIQNSVSGGRCIDTRGNIGTLTIIDSKLSTGGGGYDQPLTIGGNQSDAATVNITNSTIQTNDAGTAYYAIITFNPVNMNITESTIKGWACIYAKGPDGSSGSAGSVFDINNSTIVSSNAYSGVSNDFSAIMIEDNNVSVNVDNSNITINNTGDQVQTLVGYNGFNKNGTINLGEGNIVNFAGPNDCDLLLNGTGSTLSLTGGTYNFDPTNYLAEGYTAVENNGKWTVQEKTYVAQIGDTKFETLADAVGAAAEGQTIQVIKGGNYTLPNLPQNVTIEATVDGVVFNHTTEGSVASIPNGATFKNLTFNFGNVNYHGFQHAGTINMEDCTLNGKFFSYGDMNFTDCSFNQSNSDYHMWTYAGNVTYNNCTFTNSVTGKFLNVYNESGATKYTVTVNDCKFVNNASAANKAALNVKATSDSNVLAYDVILNNCTTEGAFPEENWGDALVVLNPVVQVDDRTASGVDNITVTQDGVLIYPAAVAAIGETKYPTLQAAVDAAQQMGGAVTVELIDDISGETVTIKEVANFKLTIDGKKDASSNYTVDALFVVDGLRGNGGSTTNGASVTLQNIAFVKTTATDGIQASHYPHHLTIQDCTYSGFDSDKWFFNASVDGPLYGVTIKNVTVEKARLIYANMAEDAVFQNITATTDCKVGFNVKTSGTALIENCQVTTGKYAFRDYSDGYEGTFTLKDNTFISTTTASDEGAIVNRGGAVGTAHINVESGTYTGSIKVMNNKEGVLAISGGYFSEEFPQSYIAADLVAQGKECVPATDKEGFYTIGDPHFVAQIGETGYKSLADAVAAVPADGTETTITMIDNETVVGNAGVIIPVGKNIVLDLNGKTVTLSVTESKGSQLITNRGTLTITDSSEGQAGKLTNVADESLAVGSWPTNNYVTNVITNSGTLNIEAGNIISTANGSICYAVDNNSTSYDAILNIKGGYLTSVGTVVRQFCNSTTKQNVINMTGGVVTTNGSAAIWTQLPGSSGQKKLATLNISGGEISASSYAWYDYSSGDSFEAVEYNISGGKFTGRIFSYALRDGIISGFISGGLFSPAPSSSYIKPAGYMFGPSEEVEGYYTLVPAEVDYSWTENGEVIHDYLPFNTPFKENYLMDGETITLLQNITLTEDLTWNTEGDATFTLNLGEFKITKGNFSIKLKPGQRVNTDKTTSISTFTSAEEGYVVKSAKDENGKYYYTAEEAEVLYTAANGTVKYMLYSSSMATSDGTYKLLKDVTTTARLAPGIMASDVTLDLNGHTLTSTATDCAVLLSRAGTSSKPKTFNLIDSSDEKGGILKVNPDANIGIQVSGKYNQVTIGEGVTIDGDCVALLSENQTLTVNGTINGGNDFAVATNGSTTKNATIIVNEGAVLTSDVAAMYLPGNEGLTATINGGTITGGNTGIELRAGQLIVNGGDITSTATEYSYTPNGNGSTTKGAAIAVVQHTTLLPIDAQILGGTLTGLNQIAVVDAQENNLEDVSVRAKDDLIVTTTIPVAFKWVSNGDGTSSLAPRDAVAQIGETKYYSLADAIAAVPANGTEATTITLLADVTENVAVSGGKNIVLDLGEKTLTGYIDLYDSELNVKNGNIAGTVYVNGGPASAEDGYNKFTLAADAAITADWGFILYQGPNGNDAYGSVIDINGTVNGTAWVMGNITEGNSVINVNNGAKIQGDVFGLNGLATLNVKEGATIIGSETGIEVRAGNLNVEGGTIKSTATKYEVKSNGSGTTTTGAAIAVAQHTTKLPINANILGGTLSGVKTISVADPEGGNYAGVVVTAKDELTVIENNVIPDGYIWESNDDGTSTLKTKEDAGIFELNDWEKPYPYLDYTEDKEAVSVTYKRRFGNTNWQALFIPFDINDISELTDRYEFAKIHMVTLQNENHWTTGDKIEVYYTKITSGKIYANKPYLIKPKKTGEQSIVVENTTLRDTHGIEPMTTSTMAADYIFTGTYVGEKATKQNIFFAMGSGTINYCDNVDLGAYRWYIKPDPKGDNYAKPSISFTEADEDATSISAAIADENTEIEGYYSVNGVRSDVPVKGMNIVKYKNGKTKKIMIK